MNTGAQCLFGGSVVTVRAIYSHAVTGRVSCLIEHPDGSYSRVGTESLAPLDQVEKRLLAMNRFNQKLCIHGVSLEKDCATCESLGGRAVECPIACPYCKGKCKRGFADHKNHRCATNSSHTWKGGD